MLYLYALADLPLRHLPEIPGHDDAAVRYIINGPWLAAVAELPDKASLKPTAESVSAHANVSARLMQSCPAILPARYGQVWSSEDRFYHYLRDHDEAIQQALRHVRGMQEFGFRLDLSEADAPEVAALRHDFSDDRPASGTAYLQGQQAKIARSDAATSEWIALLERLTGPLALRARDASRVKLVNNGRSAAMSFLVSTDRSADWKAAAEQTAQSVKRAFRLSRLSVTGPWPPYRFARLTAAQGY